MIHASPVISRRWRRSPASVDGYVVLHASVCLSGGFHPLTMLYVSIGDCPGHVVAQPLLDAGSRGLQACRATPLVPRRSCRDKPPCRGRHSRLSAGNQAAVDDPEHDRLPDRDIDARLRDTTRIARLRKIQARRSDQFGPRGGRRFGPMVAQNQRHRRRADHRCLRVGGSHSFCGLPRPLIRRSTSVHRRQRCAIRGVRVETAMAYYPDHYFRSRAASDCMVLVSAFIGNPAS